MGLLDSIKDKLQVNGSDDFYYGDDGYDDYYEDGYSSGSSNISGVLGQTSRPEAPSMSVFSHSTGRPVNESAARSNYDSPAANYEPAYSSGATGFTPAATPSYSPAASSYTPAPSAVSSSYASAPAASTSASTSNYTSRTNSLPAYVLKPTTYDDVQSIARRVRTGQPVVIAFSNCKIETAKRILDFSFGLAAGIDGKVDELDDRVFALLPVGTSISESEKDKLVADGIISRR